MKNVARIMVGSLVSAVGFAQTALAGGSYDSNPKVSDNGAEAGLLLLLALGVLIVIKGAASPAPSQNADTETDPDKTE